MIRSKYIAVCAFWLACWAGMALMPATAFAQDQAVIDKLVQMNKKALDDYDTLDFDSAKKRLLDALMTGLRHQLSEVGNNRSHPGPDIPAATATMPLAMVGL